MDATYSSTNFPSDGPFSKRRRFAPATNCSFTLSSDNNAIDNHTFDSPVLFSLGGRIPAQHEVEAELLQVGMRIRKSVSDGYKTTAFTPRPFFNMHRLSPGTQAALCSDAANRQPISTATFYGVNLAALAHITSTPVHEPQLWTYSTNHKRGYEGDSDSDDQEFMPNTPRLGGDNDMTAIPVDYFDIDLDGLGDVSPMTQPEHLTTALYRNGRRLAKPRSKKQPPPPAATLFDHDDFNPFAQPPARYQNTGTRWLGHKRMTSCGLEAKVSTNDFGETTFLQRKEDIDMDCS